MIHVSGCSLDRLSNLLANAADSLHGGIDRLWTPSFWGMEDGDEGRTSGRRLGDGSAHVKSPVCKVPIFASKPVISLVGREGTSFHEATFHGRSRWAVIFLV